MLAEEAKRLGALLVHYSTDYVFDGEKPTPYVEEDTPNPINVYGRTKLEGERAIQAVGVQAPHSAHELGVRGARQEFPPDDIAAGEGAERRNCASWTDQVGAPTWCRALAEATTRIIPRALDDSSTHGLYHATNGGETSWFGFAVEILRMASIGTPVLPITTAEYPTPAVRPANSRLDNTKLRSVFGLSLPDWRSSLAECMKDIRRA